MTTIVYDRKYIAADTQATSDNLITNLNIEKIKIHEIGDYIVYLAFSGALHPYTYLERIILGIVPYHMPENISLESLAEYRETLQKLVDKDYWCTCLVVVYNKTTKEIRDFTIDTELAISEINQVPHTAGSGRELALGAYLALQGTNFTQAPKAVIAAKIAISKDSKSGGDIKYLMIGDTALSTQ